MTTSALLEKYLAQAKRGDLKTSEYPKEWNGFKMKVSFGMGSPARVPWIAFTTSEIAVSNGYYPVYLYYKDLSILILSFGLSETNVFESSWPTSVIGDCETIRSLLGEHLPRYGDSYVYKAYRVSADDDFSLIDYSTGKSVYESEIDSDLETILKMYQQATSFEAYDPSSTLSKGVFYLEKQLEDFIIKNWENTDLGRKYNLIVEKGDLISQQYKTSIGTIDILARDKETGSYVVIELKKNQTSDATIGQIARYMGWVEKELRDPGVKGIIIAQGYDKKLEYALIKVSSVEVYVYEVDFRLKEWLVC